MINSADRNTQIAGFEMAARVMRNNPTDGLRLAGFGGDQDDVGNNNAAKIRDYVNLTLHGGLDRGEAARRVAETHTPEFQQRSRDKDFNQRVEDATRARTWAEISQTLGARDQTWAAWWRGGDRDAGPVSEALRQRFEERYQEFFRYHYRMRPDVDIAKANAAADVAKAFNRTNLFGTASSLMPYPPEHNYPPMVPLRQDTNGRPVEVASLTPAERDAAFGYIPQQAVAAAQMAFRQRQANETPSAYATRQEWVAKLQPKDIALVPNGATRQDVERRLPPRYQLWARQPGTSNWVPLANEWRADPQMAREQATDPELLPVRLPNLTGTTAPAATNTQPANPNRRDAFRANRGE